MLSALEESYPGSSLVKLYLSMVLNKNDETWGEADARLRAALSARDANSSLVPWARTTIPRLWTTSSNSRNRGSRRPTGLVEEFDGERLPDARRDEMLRNAHVRTCPHSR